MMIHPEISKMLNHEHRREMLAATDRRRPASLARREARAAKRARGIASHDSAAHRRQIVTRILLRRVWLWWLGARSATSHA
jgi:hypothetical protein